MCLYGTGLPFAPEQRLAKGDGVAKSSERSVEGSRVSGGLGGGAAPGAPEMRAAMGAAVRRCSGNGGWRKGGEAGDTRVAF